jgi:ADP-heptose:LPS heptosyltransferase
MKIAIFTAMGIGDIITLTPLLKKLKEIYPQSTTTLLTFNGGALERCDLMYVDKIIKYRTLKNLAYLFTEKYDLAIGWGSISKITNPLKQVLYRLMFYLFKAKSKIFYTKNDLKNLKGRSMPEIKLNILTKLNIPINQDDYEIFLPFIVKREEEGRIHQILRGIQTQSNSMIIFHFGAQNADSNRLWPTDRWATIITYLYEHYKAKTVTIGGSADLQITNRIMYALNPALQKEILNLTGKLNIEETSLVINHANLFISTNSGPMWIAAALKIPQIAITGPSKHEWDPINRQAQIIRAPINRKYCNPPCDLNTCHYQDNLCMTQIDTSLIITAIDNILGKK